MNGVQSPDAAEPRRYEVVEDSFQLGPGEIVNHPPGRDGVAAGRRRVVGGIDVDAAEEFLLGLVEDLRRALPLLSRQAEPLRGNEAASFAHGAGSKRHHTGG